MPKASVVQLCYMNHQEQELGHGAAVPQLPLRCWVSWREGQLLLFCSHHCQQHGCNLAGQRCSAGLLLADFEEPNGTDERVGSLQPVLRLLLHDVVHDLVHDLLLPLLLRDSLRLAIHDDSLRLLLHRLVLLRLSMQRLAL